MNTFKGKIRKYEIKSTTDNVVPVVSSQLFSSDKDSTVDPIKDRSIPSISRQIDSSIRQKYKSYEIHPIKSNRQRLRKSLKNFRCVFNFALVESPAKKRTQIQACSISLMIIAIVVISFVLVNFTAPHLTHANIVSTIVVPTENNKVIVKNISDREEPQIFRYENKSKYINVLHHNATQRENLNGAQTTEELRLHFTNNNSIPNLISSSKKYSAIMSVDTENHRRSTNNSQLVLSDELNFFCSCQNTEICMLDTKINGKAVCRRAIDLGDPTGCGGLCALETEACQLVDKNMGVRTCRQISLTTCSTHEWRCRNGFCVSLEARCNGSIQCYDRSDEMYCDCDLTKQFRCGHGISCFSNSKKCNGIVDCWDGSDETDCATKCNKDEFACTDDQCIPQEYFCDGRADCTDGSDEPSGCEGACRPHEITCDNHRCVPRSSTCDGHDDCGDYTDERNCTRIM